MAEKQQNSVVLHIRFPKALVKQLEAYAKTQRRKIADCVRLIVDDRMSEAGKR